MNDLIPAVAFPPGDYIKEALDARGWTQDEFAEIIGRTPKFVGELVSGEKSITPRTAKELAAALGTSAILWLNLEAAFRLHHSQDPVPPRITRQARLRERFAVRDMVKRGWIGASDDPGVLEGAVQRFFGIESIDDTPRLAHAAKRTGYPADISGPQLAWLFRVKQIAEAMTVGPYSERALREAFPKMRTLLASLEDVRHVPHLLAECGVRLVIVEPMPGSKIDGVTFWLGEKANSPVIGLSLRLDRIDNFWFVLTHEIAHVLNKHGRAEAIIDTDTFDRSAAQEAQNVSEEEQVANAIAAEFCVPRVDMGDFIVRHRPLFSEEKVLGFARRIQVHPGIVVGQLQRALGKYSLFRKYQVSIRPIVAPVAMTDGYGQVLPLHA